MQLKQCLLSLGALSTVLLLALAQPGQAQAQEATPQEALAYFQQQDWANAAKAYQAITDREPNNGPAWFRLGHSLHSLGKYQEAAKAYTRAVEINRNPVAMYNLACAYAKANEKEKAFDWLRRSTQAGFNHAQQLRIDDDLITLRNDARFKEAVVLAERNANPCGQTENRQFDFWVGEWEVTSGGKKIADSSIQQILGSCVIFENYSDPSGFTGKSFNFYDAVLKKWRQTWVDSQGNVSEFSGEYEDGAMHYEGESHRRDGQRFLRKMTVTKLDTDRVRQYSEFSPDGGKTWHTNYDFLYLRKKSN